MALRNLINQMKSNILQKMVAMTLLLTATFTSCEKMVLDDEDTQSQNTEANLIMKATMFNIVPFDTRAEVNIADYCSRLCFVLYKDGNEVKRVVQVKGDEGFGQAAVTIDAGTYKVLVLAHSSKGGNPVLTNPAYLQFTNSIGYSDTFYYYGDLTVTSEQQTREFTLQRATSMLRITITDQLPDELKRIRCNYEGESGVFDATIGMGGTTNSKQQVSYNVEGYTAPLTLRLYTFLRNETGTLKLTMTAHNASEEVIAEKVITDIPMKNHMVTELSGRFFDSSSSNAFTFKADTTWTVYQQLTF